MPLLLAANGGSLPRSLKWVGAPILEVIRGIEKCSGRRLPGTIVWVGRKHFTLRLNGAKEEGLPWKKKRPPPQFVTLSKAGCVLKVQWPVRLNPPHAVPVELRADTMGECRAWL